jgi:hypothetical protein
VEVERKQEKGKKNTQPDLPITTLVGIGSQKNCAFEVSRFDLCV